jgi:hypothetical protein
MRRADDGVPPNEAFTPNREGFSRGIYTEKTTSSTVMIVVCRALREER